MKKLHESQVLPSEIDSLGHMNVRYYMQRMEAATRLLAADLGLDEATLQGAFLRRADTYTRFRREQFEGAPLEVHGGVLDVNESGLRTYLELRNPEKEEVAASFITVTQIISAANRQPQPLPQAVVGAALTDTVSVPRYGQPRSLPLTPPRTDIDLEDLKHRMPGEAAPGMTSGSFTTDVLPEDVDEVGWLQEALEVMFLPFMRKTQTSNEPPGPPVHTTEDGRRVGWAVLEQRNLRFATPRLGDKLRYFGADLKVDDKTRHTRRWALNEETGALLGISDTIGICIDLDARRACPWPEELRAVIDANLQADLA